MICPIGQSECATVPGSTGGSPAWADGSGSIDEVGAERTESRARAATESMTREPSTPTPETLDTILVLLDAPDRYPAGARRRRAGFRKCKAMAVPAFSKSRKNSALRKWPCEKAALEDTDGPVSGWCVGWWRRIRPKLALSRPPGRRHLPTP